MVRRRVNSPSDPYVKYNPRSTRRKAKKSLQQKKHHTGIWG